MTGISFFLSRRVYFRIKRMYFLVCLFLLRTTSSSIWLTWVFPIIGPDSWHFAPISPRESRGDSSPSISWFVTTPNGDFPLTFLPRKACASVPQGETTDVTACNQPPTHFPRLILWAQEVRWPTGRPTAWMVAGVLPSRELPQCGKYANPRGGDGTPGLCDLSFERPQGTFCKMELLSCWASNGRFRGEVQWRSKDGRRGPESKGSRALVLFCQEKRSWRWRGVAEARMVEGLVRHRRGQLFNILSKKKSKRTEWM